MSDIGPKQRWATSKLDSMPKAVEEMAAMMKTLKQFQCESPSASTPSPTPQPINQAPTPAQTAIRPPAVSLAPTAVTFKEPLYPLYQHFARDSMPTSLYLATTAATMPYRPPEMPASTVKAVQQILATAEAKTTMAKRGIPICYLFPSDLIYCGSETKSIK